MTKHTVCTEGEVTAIGDQDQPVEDHIGLFVLPQPIQCSGKLVSITANGFCIPNNNSSSTFRIRLRIARPDENDTNIKIFRDYIKLANCTEMNNASEYRHGTVTKEYDIDVISGDSIGVQIEDCSTKNSCPFLPVIIADSGSVVRYNKKVKFNKLEIKSSSFLNFQASISIGTFIRRIIVLLYIIIYNYILPDFII